MRKFLVRLGLFTGIVALLIFGLSVNMDKTSCQSDFMAAMIDKHNRLHSIKGPRLIFVGGSSTAFGMNSEEIQKQLNIPVVNMAIIAGLGLDFILNETAAEMREGDIIILSPEYYLDVEGSYELKVFTSRCFPDAKNYFEQDYVKNLTSVRFKQIKDNMRVLANRFRKNPAIDTSDYHVIYNNRSSFNEYGDVVAHLNRKGPPALNDKGKMEYKYYKGIDKINKFCDKALAKKVKVYYMYHAYAQSQYELSSDVVQKYHSDIVKNVKATVLGQPTDFVYDDSLFFDTILHLNREGRELRTKRLIELLKQAHIGQSL